MMGADEKFVRENWEHVRSWVRDLDSYGTDQFNVALFLNEKDAKWCDNPFKRWQMDFGKEKVVWKLAAEFTRGRIEEIRLLEEEISTQGEFCQHGDECGLCAVVARTVGRLQAALAELKRGMK